MTKIIYAIVHVFIISLFANFALSGDPQKHCECFHYDCGCCSNIEVKKVLNGKLCANFSYLPDEYGISATITYNDLSIFNETISAKNPPPICIIHFDKIQMEICLKFYDLDIKNECFSGCAEFEISFYKVFPLKKLELGCFGCKNSPSITSRVHNWWNKQNKDKSFSKNNQPNVILV